VLISQNADCALRIRGGIVFVSYDFANPPVQLSVQLARDARTAEDVNGNILLGFEWPIVRVLLPDFPHE